MEKFFSVLLCLSLLFTLSAPAFATSSMEKDVNTRIEELNNTHFSESQNMADFILGYLSPFIIGVVMRYASRKWDRPLLVSNCLIFVVMVINIIVSVIERTFIVYLESRVRLFACMIFGVLTADFIYRIHHRRKE